MEYVSFGIIIGYYWDTFRILQSVNSDDSFIRSNAPPKLLLKQMTVDEVTEISLETPTRTHSKEG